MESFFADEVQDTVHKIKKLQDDGCFCFQIITDSHAIPLRERQLLRQYRSFENVQEVNRQSDIAAIFHLGDILFINPDEDVKTYWTTEHVEEWFQIVKDNLHKANPNTYFVAGNHDDEFAQEPRRDVWHRRMVACQKEKITGYVQDEPYYYIDFPRQRIRAVCLMSSFRDDEDVYYGIYEDQLQWLAEDALMVPDDWSILLFSHVCIMRSDQTDPKDRLDEFANLVLAFQEKSMYRCQTFSVDFSNIHGAEIVAMFVGHGHVDWVCQPGVEGLPFHIIETGANLIHMPKPETWPMPNGCFVAKRQFETVSEDLWDTVIYNPKKKTIDLIRFGAGEDRHIDL